MSDDIESSDVLNLLVVVDAAFQKYHTIYKFNEYFRNNLKREMLVGAFDTVTSSYGRGYVTLVSGNTVNVAMIDYGRVINTTIIKVLPEKHTRKPAYSFKVYCKDQSVSLLKVISINFHNFIIL